MLNRRYTNVYSSEFIVALEEIVKHQILPDFLSETNNHTDSINSQHLFESIDLQHTYDEPTDFAIFLLRFIGLKSNDKTKYNKNIEDKGDLIQSWMYHYSSKNFAELFTVFEFKVLFQHAYNCHLESMLQNDYTLSYNYEEYSATFKRLSNRISTEIQK